MTKPSFFISPESVLVQAGKKFIRFFCFAILFLGTGSFGKPRTRGHPVLALAFKVYVHGEPLILNRKYKNPFGEGFEISRFRFYAGRIAPLYTGYHSKSASLSSYYLIDLSDSASTRIEIPLSGDANGIQFQLGIDSADQNQGAQSGVMDPLRGMFWTWNSGFLTFKIEGYSSASGQPAHAITYHIGGYRAPYSTVWKVRINTPADEVFPVSDKNRIAVEIPIELDYFFNGSTTVHIKDHPVCTTPGELARKISENFIGSFNGMTLIPEP